MEQKLSDRLSALTGCTKCGGAGEYTDADFGDIFWRTYICDCGAYSAEKALAWISENYENVNIDHVDFRVGAKLRAEAALPTIISALQEKDM